MRKTFPLQIAGLADARVLEGIKHDVRKYLKRERRKTLPEGFTAWEFDCKVGANAESAAVVSVEDVVSALDPIAASGAESVYVEILARAGQRPARPEAQSEPQ